MSHAHADTLWLFARRCPSCGTVAIYDGKTLVRKVSLHATRLTAHQFIRVPWTHRSSGTVTVKVLTSRELVAIDGVALRAY